MAIKTIAVEVEEQVKSLLDQLEGHAAEQQTSLAWHDTRLAPAFEAAKKFIDGDFEPLEYNVAK